MHKMLDEKKKNKKHSRGKNKKCHVWTLFGSYHRLAFLLGLSLLGVGLIYFVIKFGMGWARSDTM